MDISQNYVIYKKSNYIDNIDIPLLMNISKLGLKKCGYIYLSYKIHFSNSLRLLSRNKNIT